MSSDTMKFKIYCIQEYGRAHGMMAPETVGLFERYGVFTFLNHPTLQWQDLDSTVMDIDEFIDARRQHRALLSE